MPTIKDIARAAGVSQGTVSNVLNGRGNVSVEKINLVQKAVKDLGYQTNEKARLLREGVSKSIAVILPDVTISCYAQLYSELHDFVLQKGYSLQLYQTKDMPAIEKSILKNIESSIISGIISVTCLSDAAKYYNTQLMKGISKIFALRKPNMSCNFIGFDYAAAGKELADYIIKMGYKSVGLFSGPFGYSNESDFISNFHDSCAHTIQSYTHVEAEYVEINQKSFEMASISPLPECIVSTSPIYVNALKNAYHYRGIEHLPEFIVLTSTSSLKGTYYAEYQFDFRQLGQDLGRQTFMLNKNVPCTQKVLDKTGFFPIRNHLTNPSVHQTLNLLTIASPTTTALTDILPLFQKETGIQVNVTSLDYDEAYNTIQSFGDSGGYDIFRMDMAWGQWFADKYLAPFESISNYSNDLFQNILPDLTEDYCKFNGILCAFPLDPSVQLLFYRKDLFEDAVIKRAYYEKYKTELKAPDTFEELNQIAKFFTRKYSPQSPTDYGITMVTGNIGMASCELIPRLLASQTDSPATPLIMNNAESHSALRNYLECSDYCKNTDNIWWNQAVEEFASGNTAMTIIFANHASKIIGNQSTRVAGKLGFSTIPGGKPLLGGGILGIAKVSDKKEAAMEFFNWLSRNDISLMITLLGGTSGNAATYSSPEIIQYFPWMSEVKHNFSFGVGRKNWLSSKHIIEERAIEQILGISIRNALTGNISIEKALDYAQKSINRLIE